MSAVSVGGAAESREHRGIGDSVLSLVFGVVRFFHAVHTGAETDGGFTGVFRRFPEMGTDCACMDHF